MEYVAIVATSGLVVIGAMLHTEDCAITEVSRRFSPPASSPACWWRSECLLTGSTMRARTTIGVLVFAIVCCVPIVRAATECHCN